MNRHFYKIFFIFSLIIASGKNFYSQNPAACNNTQNLCTNALFSFSASAGTGLPPGLSVSNPIGNPQAVNAGCMFTNGVNPQWLLLNVTTTGNLGFSFGAFGSAFPQAGNYDWIMWPYTPSTCVDIFNNTIPPVACNWNCSGGGGTGMGTVPFGALPCNFQPSIPVVQGQQFLILITNPSGVNTNVSFAITGSAAISCNPLKYPNLTACPGQLAVFTGTYVNASAATYTLFPGAIVQTNPSFTVSSLVNQVYTVQAQGLNSSAIPIADQTTFTLTINPVIPLTITTPTNFCYGSNAHFTINPTGAGSFSVIGPASPTSTFANTSISIPNITTPNNGTFSVVANYTNGCTGTQTTLVNVAPNNSITVSSNTNVCMNGAVNLTSSMPTATAYAWTGPGAYASGLQNPTLPAIQPASSGIYTVSSNINFNGITCPKTNTTQISVVPTNTVAVTPNFTLCQGSTLNLTSSAAPAFSYSWSGPGAYTSSTQNPVIASMLPTGSGNYSVTASFSLGPLTCTTGAVSNVSIVATSPVTVALPNNICQNATANLTVTTSPTPLSYLWSGPNSFTSNLVNPTITNIQPVASGVYSTLATYAIGSVSCTTTGTNQISVVPTSTVAVTPNFTLCQGANLNLTSSAAPAFSYSWSGPGAYTSSSQNPVIASMLPTGSGNYSVTALFTNGPLTCTTGAVSNVSIVATSPVTVALPNNICQNATANLTVTTSPTPLSYLWSGPNSFTSNLVNPTITNIQPVASGVYSTLATYAIGSVSCTTTGTNQISVVPTSTVAVTPNFTLCQGSTLNLTSSAAPAFSYSWSGPGAYTSSSQNPVIASMLPTGSGNYSVTALFTNGPLTCTTGAVSNVSVVATPSSTINYSPNICQNSTANFSVSAPGAISYTWTGPNSFSSAGATASIPNIQTNGSGIYTTTTLFSIGTVSCLTNATNSVNVVGTNSVSISTNTTVCAGATVNLTSNAASANSYSWSGPASYTSAVQNPTINGILPAGSGNYTATAFFISNNYTCNTTAVTNVSVIAIPPLTVTATNSNICIFQSTTLTASGAVNYTWTPPATLSSINGTTVSANPLVTTIYSITGADGNGCLKTNTITLVVNPLPIIAVSNNTMCLGTSALLTANGAVGYTWTPSSSLTNPNNFSVTATPSVNTTYTITGVDSKGCISSTTASVLVNSLPVLTISNHTICNGNSTSIAVSGANNYTWSPATALSSTSSPNVISNPLQTITYTVIGMNLNGCKQTTVSTVVVNQLPQILITSPSVICAGQSTVINASGALTYTWNNASITPSITVNPIVPTTYTAAGIDANGCINTGTVLLNVLIQPTLSITGSPTVCLGNALTLTASGGFDYSWNTGGTSNVVTIEPQANTIYTVNSGTAPCNSSTIFAVTVYTPQVQTPSADPTNIIYGASSVIQANIQTGNPFTWVYSSDINCNTCATNTVSPTETTIYTVTSTDNNGCVVTGTVLVQVEIICGDAFVPSAFSPNGDGFNDYWCAYGNCIVSMNLQLYNRWGEKVFESNDKNTCWDGTYNGVMQNDAVFIYQLTAKFVNGEKIVKKGNVTLKR